MKQQAPSRRTGFTVIEVMIIVILLAIIAMLAVPAVLDAGDSAKESALATQIQTIRRQVELYKHQHADRGPHLDEKGASKRNETVRRMTERTDADGKLDANGPR